jgi:hypothetical protein
MYPRVVISLLAKRLEKSPFCPSYTSFDVCPRDHYMPLQRFSMGRLPGLAKVSRGSRGTTAPLASCEPGRVTSTQMVKTPTNSSGASHPLEKHHRPL